MATNSKERWCNRWARLCAVLFGVDEGRSRNRSADLHVQTGVVGKCRVITVGNWIRKDDEMKFAIIGSDGLIEKERYNTEGEALEQAKAESVDNPDDEYIVIQCLRHVVSEIQTTVTSVE